MSANESSLSRKTSPGHELNKFKIRLESIILAVFYGMCVIEKGHKVSLDFKNRVLNADNCGTVMKILP